MESQGEKMKLYRICIGKTPSEEIGKWFPECRMVRNPEKTEMICPIRDQAALYGILKRIQELALPLLEASIIDDEKEERGEA